MKGPEHIVKISKCVEIMTSKSHITLLQSQPFGGDTGRMFCSTWTSKFHRKTTGLVLFLSSHWEMERKITLIFLESCSYHWRKKLTTSQISLCSVLSERTSLWKYGMWNSHHWFNASLMFIFRSLFNATHLKKMQLSEARVVKSLEISRHKLVSSQSV